MMSFKLRAVLVFEHQNNPLQTQQHCPQINTNKQHEPKISVIMPLHLLYHHDDPIATRRPHHGIIT